VFQLYGGDSSELAPGNAVKICQQLNYRSIEK